MACRQYLSSFPVFLWLYLCPSVTMIFSKCLLPHIEAINLLRLLLELDCLWPSCCLVFNFLFPVVSLVVFTFCPGSEAEPSEAQEKGDSRIVSIQELAIHICKPILPNALVHASFLPYSEKTKPERFLQEQSKPV